MNWRNFFRRAKPDFKFNEHSDGFAVERVYRFRDMLRIRTSHRGYVTGYCYMSWAQWDAINIRENSA